MEHLESVARQTKKTPDQIKRGPLLPTAYNYIWEWYWQLHRTRGNNGYNFNPTTFREIKAWSELTENYPKPWEVQLLKSLDLLHLRFLNKKKGE